MLTQEQCTQGTKEWLELRKGKIGASDAAPILGISPYKTALQLYEEKNGLKESGFNRGMSYGNQMEPDIRNYYHDLKDEWFLPKVFIHPENDWMIASLDGINSDETEILEIKTCNHKVFQEAVAGVVVPHYYSQGQHQLACVPTANSVEFVFYHRGEYAHVIVDRDEEYIEDMIDKERDFYETCIINKKAPDLSEKDSLDLSDNPEFMSQAFEAQLLYPEFKKLEKKWKEIKQRILDCTDDGNCHGGCLSVTRSYRKGALNEEKMLKDGIDLEKYRNSAAMSTRINVKVKKDFT